MLAPAGQSRRTLAKAIAARIGGAVVPCFHPQTEPSAVRGTPVFQNLTLGFNILDSRGVLYARCLDDLTLQADLNKDSPARDGWYRIASDDPRLLSLVSEQCDAAAPMDALLSPVAALFGTAVERNEDNLCRVNDRNGASIAILAPLPGERERPCELITRPLESDATDVIRDLLDDAHALNFSVPTEGATHLHFDGARLQSAAALSNLIQALAKYRRPLHRLVGTNQNCVRLDAWPRRLLRLADSDPFATLDWPAAQAALKDLDLSKYCDFNLVNLIEAPQDKHTFEVRILPVMTDTDDIINTAKLFAAILEWSVSAGPGRKSLPRSLADFIGDLPLAEPSKSAWANRART